MAERTVQILPGGQQAAPFTYTVPASSSFRLMGVEATLDGTAAAGAFLPCVQIFSDAGVKMIETVGSAVLAGGSADASFFPIRRTVTGVAATGFAQTVATIAAANTLRGYWRLGEVAAPFLDTSGWSGGPTDLTTSGAGAAPTTHVPGALTGGQDDGAVQLNGAPGTGQYLQNASGAINTGINGAFSIMAWVKPAASASTWVAAIYNNTVQVAGQDHGWALALVWSGGGVIARMRRIINSVVANASIALPVDAWTFLVGTYDGANLRLYSNGLLVATTADARADTFNPYFNTDVGNTFNDPFPPVGTITGDLDELAIWGTVLTLTQIQTLYAASFV